MRKKFFYTTFVMYIITLMFSLPTFAAQTVLPVKWQQDDYGVKSFVTIKSFEVTNVDIISKTKKRMYVKFDVDYTGDYRSTRYMRGTCYNAEGVSIGYFDLGFGEKYADIPICTATIIFSAVHPVLYNNNSYLYRKLVNVYAPDGRTLTVTDLEVPQYERVGWTAQVTMYAPVDGEFSKTIEISPFEVSAYEAVGWYTAEGKIFYDFKNYYYNTLKPATDYNSVFEYAAIILPSLVGTKYEQEVYKIRTEARDLWRKHCGGKPMGLIDYKISKNSIGTPEVTLHFRNLSYKKIKAYKVKFDCYNVFGNLECSYYDFYYNDNANLDIVESIYDTWTLYGADSVNTVKNIRVFEVVYEDGTKWSGK